MSEVAADRPVVAAAFPDRAEFSSALGLPDGKAVRTLRVLLIRLRPDAPLAELGTQLEHLGRFVVAGPAPGQVPAGLVGAAGRIRFEMLVTAVERVPEARARVAAALGALLRQTSAVRLLAVIGQPNDRGLWAEVTDRLAARVLPTPPDHRDLAALAARFIRAHHDYDWLGPDSDALLDRFEAAMGEAWEPDARGRGRRDRPHLHAGRRPRAGREPPAVVPARGAQQLALLVSSRSAPLAELPPGDRRLSGRAGPRARPPRGAGREASTWSIPSTRSSAA
jgi:hypothetical protein